MQKDLERREALHPVDPRFELKVAVANQIGHWARLTPDAVAVADEHGSLTYQALQQRVDLLCAKLDQRQLPSESVVALLLERSVDFVVAALATMKMGAAYLPLDASTPSARIAAVLTDSQASVVLTHRTLGRLLPENVASENLDLLNSSETRAAMEPRVFDAEALAYVIYTSGSTGTPKGVEITRGNLANLIVWHRQTFELKSADRISQVAGLGFDAAGWEIWPALAAGASVHFASESVRRTPQLLRDWLIEQKINISFAPTLLAEQMIQMPWPSDASLRYLLTGAETLHRRPPAGLPFTLVNNYGPTECTVVSTSCMVEPQASPADTIGDFELTRPSIGLPIGDAVALVLDDSLHEVAAGEVGELCLAGALVGRGYRNNPDLTAEKFVYWSDGSRALRVYRTGDKVRQRADGQLTFLGRTDDQIKIRGYRVEPGEIVASLCTYCDVQAAAVVPDADSNELIAYVVLKDNAGLSADRLQVHLSALLPQYMVPKHFVRLTELPTTVNGKLDKTKLPEVHTEQVDPATRGNVKQLLGSLIGELLGQNSVAPDANFFMIGGHSMLGVQLVAKIRDQFGVKLALRQLFKAPTINALTAEVLRAAPAM